MNLWMDEQAARTELTTMARELGMGVRKDDDSDDAAPSEAQLLAFALRVVKMAKLAVLDECLTICRDEDHDGYATMLIQRKRDALVNGAT